jgi:signal peptide peptidase SppA
MNDFQTESGQRVAIPHMDQYFGLWMHEPCRLEAMVDLARRMDMSAHVAEGAPLVKQGASIVMEGGLEAEWDAEARLLRIGNVAMIDLSGTLTKYGSSMSSAGSMISARRQLARATRDKSVDSILLRIDSPGGTVAGTGDLAAEIAAANAIKPVTAFIEDLGASAAYYLASQAGRILMNSTGEVGSIGVFMLVYDMSGAAAQQGIKAILVKAGDMKGAGAPGTEITEAQRAEWQRSVNEAYDQFIGAVARGRGMSGDQARAMADGRIWGASDAMDKGLIDGISTLSEAVTSARNRQSRPRAVAQGMRATIQPTARTSARGGELLAAVDRMKAQEKRASRKPGQVELAPGIFG